MNTCPEHAPVESVDDFPSANINGCGETDETSPCPSPSGPSDSGTTPDNENVCTTGHALRCDTEHTYNVTTTQFDVPVAQLLEIYDLLRPILEDPKRCGTSKRPDNPSAPEAEGASN